MASFQTHLQRCLRLGSMWSAYLLFGNCTGRPTHTALATTGFVASAGSVLGLTSLYGSDRAAIRVRDMAVLDGQLPARVLGLVVEWGTQHRDELLADWARSARQLPLVPIAPLE